jgi:hypothetical protein
MHSGAYGNFMPNSGDRQGPHGSGYVDRLSYRSVHFHGAKLADPLAEAASYLRTIEDITKEPPLTLCVHTQFSWEDDKGDLAWQVTVVLSEAAPDR